MCPYSRCRRQPCSLWLFLSLLVSGLLTLGCSEELGPEHFPTTRVTGIVVEGKRPVGGGWIEFIPCEGTVGIMRSARIAKDGSFQADRVAIGENLIRLVNSPIAIPGGAILFAKYSSPIHRKIPPHLDVPMTIDLMEEVLRYQAVRPQPVGRKAGPSASGAQP